MNTATSTRILATRTLAALALLLCATAQAQSVRKCTIDGHVVFQSSPCPLEARPAVAAPQAAADPASAPKKKALAELLRERDGTDRVRPPAREFSGGGATVLRARMGAV